MVGGTPSSKPEFPPLLAAGRHPMTIAELRRLCVDGFPLSTTRPAIMTGLETVVERLHTNSVEGEIWVDGSFVTEKINPEDVDLVLRLEAYFYEKATQNQRETIAWLSSNLKNSLHCDSYLFMEWPENHPNYWLGQKMYNYWMRQFGFSRGSEMKGIPVLSLTKGEQQ